MRACVSCGKPDGCIIVSVWWLLRFWSNIYLFPGKTGARWFWDTLVDADLANNSAGWQWVAGCGADAAPYFRIFNPILQGKKFDKTGAYVYRWVPELSGLPLKYVHEPWHASSEILDAAGVCLGRDYPLPIVDHARCPRTSADGV